MSKYWFKPRRFGWGFTPISWEGWTTVFLMLVAVGTAAYVDDVFNDFVQTKDGFRFLLDLFFIVSIFSIFSTSKTNGVVKWRWR